MQFPSLPCYVFPLRLKDLPQHPVLEQPQAMFFPQRELQSLTPIHNNSKIIVLYFFFNSKLEDRRFWTE